MWCNAPNIRILKSFNLYKSSKQNFQFVNERGLNQFKFYLMASPKESHQSILDGDQKIEEKESFSHAIQLVTSIVLPMTLRPLSLWFLIS